MNSTNKEKSKKKYKFKVGDVVKIIAYYAKLTDKNLDIHKSVGCIGGITNIADKETSLGYPHRIQYKTKEGKTANKRNHFPDYLALPEPANMDSKKSRRRQYRQLLHHSIQRCLGRRRKNCPPA